MQHLAKNSKAFFAIVELVVKLGFASNVMEASRLALTGIFLGFHVPFVCFSFFHGAFFSVYADIGHEFVPQASIPPGEFLRAFSVMQQQESKTAIVPFPSPEASSPLAVVPSPSPVAVVPSPSPAAPGPVVLDVCMTATVGTETLEEEDIAMLLLQLA